MKKEIFVLYDAKAGFYENPFFLRSRGEALRFFTDIVNDKKNNIGQHPEDFCLYCLGKYDCINGKFELINAESLGFGIEYVKKIDIQEVSK